MEGSAHLGGSEVKEDVLSAGGLEECGSAMWGSDWDPTDEEVVDAARREF